MGRDTYICIYTMYMYVLICLDNRSTFIIDTPSCILTVYTIYMYIYIHIGIYFLS
jgi:hypothetical protein